MSIKQNRTGEQFVPGNLDTFLQSYHIDYYPPEVNYPTDKIWLYLQGKENGKPRMIRSLCFKNPQNHTNFIINNIYAHIFQVEQRSSDSIPSTIPIEKYRMILLDGLLSEIRKKIISMWRLH